MNMPIQRRQHADHKLEFERSAAFNGRYCAYKRPSTSSRGGQVVGHFGLSTFELGISGVILESSSKEFSRSSLQFASVN